MQNRELNTCKHDIYSFLRFSLPTNTEPGGFVSGIPHLFSLFSLHIRRFIRLAAIPAAAFFTHKGFNKASCHLIMNYEL